MSQQSEPRLTLPNKPLVEAIFELRWHLKSEDGAPPFEPAWKMLPGLFFGKVQQEYPIIVDLPISEVPDQLAPYTVRHQFRVAEGQWPLIQLGPGIITVNETEGYTTWINFHQRIRKALDALNSIYPGGDSSLHPMQAELRFINAVPLGEDAMSPLSFLSEKLHTDVKNTCILSGISQANPSAISVSLGLTHQLSSPIGEGHLLFAHGKSKGVASIIWHLAVRTKNAPLPAAHDFETWLDTAHDTIESWFLSLSDGQLLENFRGGNNADV